VGEGGMVGARLARAPPPAAAAAAATRRGAAALSIAPATGAGRIRGNPTFTARLVTRTRRRRRGGREGVQGRRRRARRRAHTHKALDQHAPPLQGLRHPRNGLTATALDPRRQGERSPRGHCEWFLRNARLRLIDHRPGRRWERVRVRRSGRAPRERGKSGPQRNTRVPACALRTAGKKFRHRPATVKRRALLRSVELDN